MINSDWCVLSQLTINKYFQFQGLYSHLHSSLSYIYILGLSTSWFLSNIYNNNYPMFPSLTIVLRWRRLLSSLLLSIVFFILCVHLFVCVVSFILLLPTIFDIYLFIYVVSFIYYYPLVLYILDFHYFSSLIWNSFYLVLLILHWELAISKVRTHKILPTAPLKWSSLKAAQRNPSFFIHQLQLSKETISFFLLKFHLLNAGLMSLLYLGVDELHSEVSRHPHTSPRACCQIQAQSLGQMNGGVCCSLFSASRWISPWDPKVSYF